MLPNGMDFESGPIWVWLSSSILNGSSRSHLNTRPKCTHLGQFQIELSLCKHSLSMYSFLYVLQFSSDLRTLRAKLLTALTDPGNSIASIEAAANEYISVLQGLCCDIGGQGESKLRKCVNFKWTNSIGGSETW